MSPVRFRNRNRTEYVSYNREMVKQPSATNVYRHIKSQPSSTNAYRRIKTQPSATNVYRHIKTNRAQKKIRSNHSTSSRTRAQTTKLITSTQSQSEQSQSEQMTISVNVLNPTHMPSYWQCISCNQQYVTTQTSKRYLTDGQRLFSSSESSSTTIWRSAPLSPLSCWFYEIAEMCICPRCKGHNFQNWLLQCKTTQSIVNKMLGPHIIQGKSTTCGGSQSNNTHSFLFVNHGLRQNPYSSDYDFDYRVRGMNTWIPMA